MGDELKQVNITVGLKDYVDRRIDDLEKRIFERFTLNDAFLSKTESALRDRLQGMNEFREALKDQTNKMATRLEVEKIEREIQILTNRNANFDGRLVILSGIISIVISMSIYILSKMFIH
jgi:hypothetical protein